MDHDQGVDAALRNQPCGHDGLPERGACRQNAGIVRQQGSRRRFLFRTKGAAEAKRKRDSRVALIPDGGPDFVPAKQFFDRFQAAPWKSNEFPTHAPRSR